MANAPIPYDLTGELDGDLANARLVSSRLAVQDGPAPNAVGATDMVWQWGRLLDHDLSLSPEAAHGEGVPIRMATGDPTFDPFRTGRRFIPFNRSAYDAATGTGLDNPREQVGHCPDQGQGPSIPKRAQAVTPGLQRRRLHAEFHRPRLRQHHRHHHSRAHMVTNIRGRVLSRSTGGAVRFVRRLPCPQVREPDPRHLRLRAPTRRGRADAVPTPKHALGDENSP